jgi:hypothetical protein
MSRASFPFVVVNELNNGTHNGLATFLFDETRVSALSFQLVQETMAWDRNDYWGRAPLAYAAGTIADESDLRARFDEELRRQAPMRPWSALPASARPLLDGFDGEVDPDDVSASGLVVDGVLYVRGCNTRYGPYPYCREMRHGVFSVTKSLGAAIALLRLAQKYGDAVFDTRIADYLAITAPHDGWERVTFADALGMATGIGERSPQRHPSDPLADENKPRMLAWVGKRTAKDKLDAGFAYPKYPWGPGQVVRYNSVHTFVLAAAMDAYLKHRAGPGAHLWDMVVREVYEPIGIFHAPMLHTLETMAAAGSRCSPTGSIRPSTTSPSSPRCSSRAADTTGSSSSARRSSRRRSIARARTAACPSAGTTAPARGAITCRSGRPPTARAPAASCRSRSCSATAATWSCCCPTASRRSGSPTPAAPTSSP